MNYEYLTTYIHSKYLIGQNWNLNNHWNSILRGKKKIEKGKRGIGRKRSKG
jgi:hypothetical protein